MVPNEQGREMFPEENWTGVLELQDIYLVTWWRVSDGRIIKVMGWSRLQRFLGCFSFPRQPSVKCPWHWGLWLIQRTAAVTAARGAVADASRGLDWQGLVGNPGPMQPHGQSDGFLMVVMMTYKFVLWKLLVLTSWEGHSPRDTEWLRSFWQGNLLIPVINLLSLALLRGSSKFTPFL